MKRFWIVLLSAALVMAFSLTASAQTKVTFSGGYYAHGFYVDNYALNSASTAASTFVAQRFRLQTVFTVAEGLSVTTRFDALERVWGAKRNQAGVGGTASNTPLRYDDENIGFERAFVTFTTKVGRFSVGYQPAASWGTLFGDSGTTRPRVSYAMAQGPLTLLAIYEKQIEGMPSNPPAVPTASDNDFNMYYLAGIYTWKTGNAGLLYANMQNSALGASWRGKSQALIPYFKANFGPLYLEGEANIGFGKTKEFVSATAGTDIDDAGLAYYLGATYKMGPLAIGGFYAVAQGDDPATTTKQEGGKHMGADFEKTLILWNGWTNKWHGSLTKNGQSLGDEPANVNMWQLNAAYAVSKELNLFASYTSASMNQKGANVSDSYGTEIDVTASYKIFGNLEYVLGFGYLMTGDAFKGANAANTVGNNYLIQHRLNLTF
ncbi:MAG: porin [Smithellaceae bacterium]|nr:porin [Smithellaceae bacterium]